MIKTLNKNQSIDEIIKTLNGDGAVIIAADKSHYSETDTVTMDAIRLFAEKEALIAYPVYEGKATRGILELNQQGRFEKGSRTLLMHLDGSPATHAYANHFDPVNLQPLPNINQFE